MQREGSPNLPGWNQSARFDSYQFLGVKPDTQPQRLHLPRVSANWKYSLSPDKSLPTPLHRACHNSKWQIHGWSYNAPWPYSQNYRVCLAQNHATSWTQDAFHPYQAKRYVPSTWFHLHSWMEHLHTCMKHEKHKNLELERKEGHLGFPAMLSLEHFLDHL